MVQKYKIDPDCAVRLLEMLICCPCGKYLDSCPFLEPHQKEMPDKISWIAELDNDLAQEMVQNCDRCKQERMNG